MLTIKHPKNSYHNEWNESIESWVKRKLLQEVILEKKADEVCRLVGRLMGFLVEKGLMTKEEFMNVVDMYSTDKIEIIDE